MSIEIVTKFISPSTVWIRVLVYDPKTGDLVDPTTSIKVTVADKDGTKVVTAQDMTKDGVNTGTYDYYYNLPSSPVEGWYPGEVTVVDGSGDTAKTSVASFGFDVTKGIS